MHTDGGPNQPPDPLRRFDRKPEGPGRLVGLGFQFAAAIVLCVFIGQWADRRCGTDPWGVLVGTMIGFAVGLLSLLRAAGAAEGDGPGQGEGGDGGTGKRQGEE